MNDGLTCRGCAYARMESKTSLSTLCYCSRFRGWYYQTRDNYCYEKRGHTECISSDREVAGLLNEDA